MKHEYVPAWQYAQPMGVTGTRSGALMVVSQLNTVILLNPNTGQSLAIAGTGKNGVPKDGAALSAVFNSPKGLALSDSESAVYVLDGKSARVRRLTLPKALFEPMHPNTGSPSLALCVAGCSGSLTLSGVLQCSR
jgi:hypothetical protein